MQRGIIFQNYGRPRKLPHEYKSYLATAFQDVYEISRRVNPEDHTARWKGKHRTCSVLARHRVRRTSRAGGGGGG